MQNWRSHNDSLGQACSNSIVLTMELLQSCINPSILRPTTIGHHFLGGIFLYVYLYSNVIEICFQRFSQQ